MMLINTSRGAQAVLPSRCKIDIVVSGAAQRDESHASSGEFFNHTAIDEIVYENTHGTKSSREPGGLFV